MVDETRPESVDPLVCRDGHDEQIMDTDVFGTSNRRSARHSDSDYRAIFEASTDGLIVLSTDGIVVEANPTACRMHGYRYDEFKGMSPRGFIHPDDHALFDEFMKTVKADHFFRNVGRDVRKDGSVFDVDVRGSLIMFQGVPHLLGVIRDITEHKQAQERLAVSESLFKTIFETEPACVKLLDQAGNLLDMNPAGLAMIEADSLAQVQGQPILRVIDPADRERFVEASDAVFRGESRTLQFAIVGSKGTRLLMESHEVPLRDDEGNIKALLAVTQDITDRKRSELMLASRNQVLERIATGASLEETLITLVETIEDVTGDMLASVLLLDQEAKCLHCGAAPNLPDFYNAAIDGLAIGPCVGSCGTAAYTGTRVIVEDVMTHPFWSKFRELAQRARLRACWSEPIRSSGGTTLGTFAMYYREPRGPTAVDLEWIQSAAHLAAVAIEHKQSEEALRKAHDELELRVQQRTQELARSNEALENSNRDLQYFAYIASHDLQEPLRMVASYCDLLKRRYRGQLDQDADDFIDFAVDGATRMQTLIRDLLSYSRLQTEVRPWVETDCNTVVENAIRNLSTSIETTNASVTQDTLPSVVGDRSQLAEVFQNLIDNAIKYRGPDPPRVHIAATQQEDTYVFSVRDNGIGIDRDDVGRIFTIFKRLHSHDRIPGTGIGLAICQRAVERHRGRIWVESQPDRGSTFYFTIPIRGQQTT